MSWSKTVIGKPENVAAALEAHSETLGGASKIEYDQALPHMVGLVKQNIGSNMVVKVTASGHGYVENGVIKNNQCSFNLEMFYAELV
jgi:hypothetical protein